MRTSTPAGGLLHAGSALTKCSDYTVANQGAEAPKPRLSPVKDAQVNTCRCLTARRLSFYLQSTRGQLSHATSSLKLWRNERGEENCTTVHQIFDMYNRSWHLIKMVGTKSRQNLILDLGGRSGRMCRCPFWKGGARCIVGGGI